MARGPWSVNLVNLFSSMRCPAIDPKLILGALKTFETLLGERRQVARGLGGDVAGPLGKLQGAPGHP